jgi:hypothetical protein
MNLPGLLIEYLVNGAIALTWLYPSIAVYLADMPAPLLPVVAVALYVVGMMIDVVAWGITRPLKHWLRRSVHRKYAPGRDPEAVSGTMRHAKIALHAPELARELETRSSRDRIARGLIVNAVLATVTVLPWWAGIPLVAASILMWSMFEKLSYMYELCAERVVDEKIQQVK